MATPSFTLLPLQGHRLRWELTVTMALLSVLVTFGVWRQSRESAIEKAHALFDLRVEELAHAVALRAADYEHLLRGARGLFAANRAVGAREWRAYVQELNVGSLYLGLESLFVLRVIDAAEIDRFVAERRKDPETPNFALQTDQRRQSYVVMSFIEPRLPRNSLVLGRDFAAEPTRAAALARARDSQQPTATAPLRLFTLPASQLPSVSIYVPIYRSGQPTESVEDRRRALVAYVGDSIRIESMIEAVVAGLQREVAADAVERMAFAITDVTDPAVPLALYDRGLAATDRSADAFRKTMVLDVSSRQWMIEAMALPSLPGKTGESAGIWTRAVALFGLLLTGLTHALVVILENRADLRRAYARLAEREAELDLLAHSDPLTGVANRRHFFMVGTREWALAKRHGRALSVLMIDVDHFKAINDTHGHGIGDETLKRLAAACRTTLRDCDLIARMGGEEFAVLLSEIDLAAAQAVAERLRQIAAEMRVPNANGAQLSLTVSIGAACLCPDDESLDDLVSRADRALYAAKAGGRNQVIVAETEEPPLLALAAVPDR